MKFSNSLRRLGPWIAAVIVLAVVGLAIYAYVNPEALRPGGGPGDPGRSARRPALRGTACGNLENARDALVDGNEKHVADFLREARKQAIEALNKSGIRFGKPEAVALRLSGEPFDSRPEAAKERILESLEGVSDTCKELPT
jgi:hypothetical protein